MILIGSAAIKYWFPNFPREPKDLDVVVGTEKDKANISLSKKTWEDTRVEVLVNPVLAKYVEEHPSRPDFGQGLDLLLVDELYTLKISHAIGWKLENNSWDKHVFDIQFLKNKGAKLIKPLFFQLYEYWETVHGPNKRSDLDMTSEEFFDNALDCPYDHDWLHTLLKPTPTFTKVLKDGAEVDVSEEKFNQLSEEEKEDLVREEVYIMAFERFSHMWYPYAYARMLRKFVIGHAPIWEAIWILENWPKLIHPKFNFVKLLNEKINENNQPA